MKDPQLEKFLGPWSDTARTSLGSHIHESKRVTLKEVVLGVLGAGLVALFMYFMGGVL
jgi:hypothetical protein